MINALGHQEKIRKKDVLNERPPHGAYKYRRQNVGMKKYAERKKRAFFVMEYSYYLKFSQKLKLCEISLIFFGGGNKSPILLIDT